MPRSGQRDRAAVCEYLGEGRAAVAQRMLGARLANEEQCFELDPRPVGGIGVERRQCFEIGRRARQQVVYIGTSSEERRVGKEGVNTCRSMWPPHTYKTKLQIHNDNSHS